MISLSRRITIGTVVLTVAVVGLAVVLVWLVARWQAVRVLDVEVAEHASRLEFMAGHGPRLPRDPRHQDGPEAPGLPPPLRAGTGWLFVEVVEDGQPVFRSPSLADPAVSLAGPLGAQPPEVAAWLELDGKSMRGMRVVTGRTTGYVARDATATLAELRRLALTLGGVWATASLLALLSAWWLRRAVVGPLERLGAGIRTIDPERLDGRLEVAAPAEVAETVRLLNGLLARLAVVMQREKVTIANIAHELRSPISGLRTTLEVAALDPATRDPVLAARCLPTVVAMHTMVANLLTLARLEAGQEQVVTQAVDLDALVSGCWATLAPVAHGRDQHLQLIGKAGRVLTCPDKVRMILANLLDNAITHAPPGSAILVMGTAPGGDGLAWLRIANPLAGDPPDLDHIFDPFWRGDTARTSPQHCGLGLALAKRIADLLVARLRIEVADGSFVVHLGLPAAA